MGQVGEQPASRRLDTAELSALAAQAAELGYAAIALKCRDAQVEEIRTIASSSTLPVIRVAETVSWRVFEAQLARLLGEQRRAEAERRAVVGRLTAELGHDLNSPIASASADRGTHTSSSSQSPIASIAGIAIRRAPRRSSASCGSSEQCASTAPFRWQISSTVCASARAPLPIASVWAIRSA